MYKIILFFSYLLSFTYLVGQTVEKLEKELQQTVTVAQKVDLLDSIAYLVRNTDEKKCFNYISQAYQLAKKHDYTLGIAREGLMKAWYWHYKNYDHDSALYYYQEAYSYYQKLKNNEKICKTLSEIGLLYHNKNDLEQALSYQIKALSIGESNKTVSDRLLGNIHYRIANVYVDQQDNSKAIEYYHKALYLYEKAGFKVGIASANIGLGNLYEATERVVQSIQFKEKALKNYTELKDTSMIVVCLVNLSNSYNALKQYNKSIEIALQANTLLNHVKNKDISERAEVQLKIWLLLADLYNLKKDKNKANSYLQKLHTYIISHRPDTLFRHSVKNDIYAAIFNIAKNIDQKDMVISYAEKWLTVKDSLYAENKVKILYELEKKYKTEKKEQEIKILNVQKKQEIQKKQFYSVLFVLSMVVLLGLGFLLMYLRKLNQRLYEQKQNLTQLNEVKNRLFSVISHDLRTPIHQMSRYLDTLKPDTDMEKQYHQEIREKLYHTQNLVDSVLHWAKAQMGKKSISIGRYELAKIIDEVFEHVQNQAESKNVLLVNETDSNIYIDTDKDILQIVLRNLLTNSIKFSQVGSVVRVYSVQAKSKIDIFVQDYGTGMSEADLHALFKNNQGQSNEGTEQEKGTGTGFQLILDYIKQLNGQIQGYSKLNDGTTFQISLFV
jgi:signal transduction histidine kinase